jgi:hypothetical protein
MCALRTKWTLLAILRPTDRMVLGSTQPLTEMSTSNLPGKGGGGEKGQSAREADLNVKCEPFV